MTPDRHLGAAWVSRCCPDILITESTYATTIRDSKRAREREFLEKIHARVEAGGKVLTVSNLSYSLSRFLFQFSLWVGHRSYVFFWRRIGNEWIYPSPYISLWEWQKKYDFYSQVSYNFYSLTGKWILQVIHLVDKSKNQRNFRHKKYVWIQTYKGKLLYPTQISTLLT